jgi:tetratricopeptide (TPR) repeat protein
MRGMNEFKSLASALIFCLMLAASVCAQTKDEKAASEQGTSQTNSTAAQTPELQEAVQMSEKVIRLFNEKAYDQALELAKRVLEIREKALAPDDKLVIEALYNLAEIYIAKNMYKEAEPFYQRLLAHYDKSDGVEAQKTAKTLERLAYISFRKEKFDEAEIRIQRAFEIYEKSPEADWKQLASLKLQLAELYYSKGDNNKAEAAYLRAIELSEMVKEPPDSKIETTSSNAIERYICFLYQTRPIDEARNIEHSFTEKRNAGRRSKSAKTDKENMLESGVLNGRAISLPKPDYPARVNGVRGVIRVHITINEQGEVIEAKAICGPTALRGFAERAALRARFTPTLLSGQPVKVTGLINYNFGTSRR